MFLINFLDKFAFGDRVHKVKRPWHYVSDEIYEWMQTIVFVGVFYLSITVFLVEGYQIPSSSMEPTFIGHPNVVKGDRIFAIKGISRFFPPKRGDIIIFVSAEDQETFIVKRLVGMPGETIEIKQGRIYINNELLEDPPIFKELRYWLPRDRYDHKVPMYAWKTVYDQEHPNPKIREFGRAFERPKACFGQYYEELARPGKNFAYQIPQDCYFVMGDNSRHSHDSRYWGFLPKRNVFGKASLIWWPIDRGEILHSGLPSQQFSKAMQNPSNPYTEKREGD